MWRWTVTGARYIATLTGDHDVLVDVFCRDVPHLSRLVHEDIQSIEGISSITSYLVTDIKYDSSLRGLAGKWLSS